MIFLCFIILSSKFSSFSRFFSDLISIQGLYLIYSPRYIKENRLDNDIMYVMYHI